jgi:hypothetical protein
MQKEFLMHRHWAVFVLLCVAANPPKGTEVRLDGLSAVTPGSWKAENARGHLYQFQITQAANAKEAAEVTITRLPNRSATDQIAQIKDLFLLPTTLPKDQAVREWTIQHQQVVIRCLDIQGTYRPKRNSVEASVREVRPDYRLLTAVWTSPQGAYLIRMVGPKQIVSSHVQEFEQWLRSFK